MSHQEIPMYILENSHGLTRKGACLVSDVSHTKDMFPPNTMVAHAQITHPDYVQYFMRVRKHGLHAAILT